MKIELLPSLPMFDSFKDRCKAIDYARACVEADRKRLAPEVMRLADRYALEYDSKFYEGGYQSREERAALAKLLEV